MVTLGHVYELLVTTRLDSPTALQQLEAGNNALPANFPDIITETLKAAEALRETAAKHGIALPETSEPGGGLVQNLSALEPVAFAAVYNLPLASGLVYLMLHNHLRAKQE